jgi:hypothetical protein
MKNGRIEPRAAFKQAVLDLSEAPTPLNARRYLAASQLLEQTAPSRNANRKPRTPSTPAVTGLSA